MPKIKSHRGAAKRFKKTGSGHFKRSHSMKRHILTKKSAKRKRHLRHSTLVSVQEERMLSIVLPY